MADVVSKRVSCYFCGRLLNVPVLDELFARRMAKNIPASKKETSKELMTTDWKYVCHDCTKTEEYREWMFTPEAIGHMAMAPEANISLQLEFDNYEQIEAVKVAISRDLVTLQDLLQSSEHAEEEKQIECSIDQLQIILNRLNKLGSGSC